MMRLLKIRYWFLLLPMAYYLLGCYPHTAKNPTDLDVVITNYNPDFNFKSKKTFFIPDTVNVLNNDTTKKQKQVLEWNLNKFIINKIITNMTARGYQRLDTVNIANDPDLIVMASFLNSAHQGTTYVASPNYNPYWGSYYGWGSGYGYYSSYYPVNYSYNTGTVFIEIIDTRGVDVANKQIPIVWRAIFNGILTDLSDLTTRLNTSIDQAFTQSPYL